MRNPETRKVSVGLRALQGTRLGGASSRFYWLGVMQQILCFEIVQSKVQLSNRKVGVVVEQHTTPRALTGRDGGGRQHEKTKWNYSKYYRHGYISGNHEILKYFMPPPLDNLKIITSSYSKELEWKSEKSIWNIIQRNQICRLKYIP